MTKFFIISTIIFLTNVGYGCNCFIGDENLYETYSKSKFLYLGKIVKKVDATHYEFEIIKSYKGKHLEKIIIESTHLVSCGLGELKIDDIYLINPNYIDGKFSVSKCNFNRQNTSTSFKNDTTCLAAITNKNIYVKAPYFNGQIKSGKRTGSWTEYFYQDTFRISSFSGNYVNDKREGIWVDSEGVKYLYKKGTLIKTLTDK